MTASTLLYFIGASMALSLVPGPDNIFVIMQGITRGRKPAIIAALGMCSGISVHTTAAAFGLSVIFYSSIIAFNVVKYAGAVYLVYLAYLSIKEKSLIKLSDADDMPVAALYRRGFFMNVLNPKVAMFFLAFLPQFISPATSHFSLYVLAFGLIFMVQATVIFCLIGYFSGSIGTFIQTRPTVARYFNWLTAGIFTSLAIRLALAKR